MAKITPESIADLKALFQDNEKALGANFSQLIDFFNNNKVTDNGDGTFTVGTVTVDASKLYDLINNSSPNILPLDNEFTGKNTFDIAPINKANGKPYITADSVPQVDLSNYPTKDQLATKADTSAIDPSVLLGAIPIASTTDLFTLDPGTYFGKAVTPVNGPAINSLPATNYFWVKMETTKATASIKKLTWTDNGNNHYTNDYYGAPAKWHSWQVPNAGTMATKSDVTTAISTATSNMADTTKATNFTNGLQSGGVNVATAADIKSIEDQAWHTIALPDQQASKNLSLLYQVDKVNKQLKINLRGTFISATSDWKSGLVIADFGSIITSITSADIYVTFIKRFTDDTNANFTGWNYSGTTSAGVATTIEFNGSKVLIRCSDASVNNGYGKLSVPGGEDFAMVNNTINYANLV